MSISTLFFNIERNSFVVASVGIIVCILLAASFIFVPFTTVMSIFSNSLALKVGAGIFCAGFLLYFATSARRRLRDSSLRTGKDIIKVIGYRVLNVICLYALVFLTLTYFIPFTAPFLKYLVIAAMLHIITDVGLILAYMVRNKK